ncbi:hypothetical protein RRG08_020225 [Elysia crispata]|uniref:Uncharacterized protein n=1 Tax=Elysia crispata TaxID=231223 RepID=A0AAE1DRR2_9GAST|nr:hypothetical protein RRG08_020225 [Elysia crispata]
MGSGLWGINPLFISENARPAQSSSRVTPPSTEYREASEDPPSDVAASHQSSNRSQVLAPLLYNRMMDRSLSVLPKPDGGLLSVLARDHEEAEDEKL